MTEKLGNINTQIPSILLALVFNQRNKNSISRLALIKHENQEGRMPLQMKFWVYN